MKASKSYEVKEWMAKKVANEVKKNIAMCDVFAILKETEKAVYAMLNLGTNFRKCMWIPKSALVEREIGLNANGSYNHETYIEADYDKAVEMFTAHWNQYR